MRKDLLKLNEYNNDETMLINLICSNRVLDISDREDINDFKSWVKTMLEYATRKEKIGEVKIQKCLSMSITSN